MVGTDLAPKLGRLVRLLGSPVDGEALGAARALNRALRGAGHDLHWLAGRIEAGLEPKVEYRTVIGTKAPEPTMLPPLFESLPRSRRLTWLDHAVASTILDDDERLVCTAVRATTWAQLHKRIAPKQVAAVSLAIGKLWITGVRA